ncbi:MAG: UDP-2,3-diacylglucosamine diphosphatase [Congregibacter sp.]
MSARGERSKVATYFISDLHLDASRPWVVRALSVFLQDRRDAHALYILGDLFEFWVGDDDDSELVTQVADLLADYSAAGPELYLMHGNRDFLIGEAFAARVGAQLLPDPSVVMLGREKQLLTHGDSLCTRDEDYQAFRKIARSSEWQTQMLAQSLDDRRQLAQKLRMASRDAGSRKAADIMDVTETEVLALMRENDCTTMIHGHTHRPARHENSAGLRWVLGDWDAQGWYLQWQDNALALETFAIAEHASSAS